jgi:hypothetical protein
MINLELVGIEYWFTSCARHEGEFVVFGPFEKRASAETEASEKCQNAHLIGHGVSPLVVVFEPHFTADDWAGAGRWRDEHQHLHIQMDLPPLWGWDRKRRSALETRET